jgi:xanthine dehydrogenase accessory factor
MNDKEMLAALLAALDRRQAVALVTATTGAGALANQVGRRLLVLAGNTQLPMGDLAAPQLDEQILRDVRVALAKRTGGSVEYHVAGASLQLFIDIQVPPPQLLIVGAGHIAAPLAEIGHICDFEVTVLDDRPQYANRQRFPTADHVIAGAFVEELRRLRRGQPAFDENTYLVLVTRGHQYDVACLLEVLDDPVAYIGMIGSQRRIRAVYELLEREQGVAPEKFDRIYAPIGLAIGAQTPAEIAVCIMAEIISVQRRAAGNAAGNAAGGSLSAPLLRQRQARRGSKPAGQPES